MNRFLETICLYSWEPYNKHNDGFILGWSKGLLPGSFIW